MSKVFHSNSYMGVSKNRGLRYPKMDDLFNGKTPIKMDDLGVPGTTIFGNTHLPTG